MKMTIHQRLRAQRKAEHSKAVAAAHRRAVLRNPVDCHGVRCHSCRDVPLHLLEIVRMTQEDWDWYHDDQETWARWDADPLIPCPDDPKHWHIQYALGYWE